MALSDIVQKISALLTEAYPHEMTDQTALDISYLIESELLDKELAKARTRLPFFSSPEEYWMTQGKIHFIKEVKEKLHYRDDKI